MVAGLLEIGNAKCAKEEREGRKVKLRCCGGEAAIEFLLIRYVPDVVGKL